MDEFQKDIAEKIYQKAKLTGGLPDIMFAQAILTENQRNDPRRIKDVKLLIEVLVDQGLLKSEPQRNSNYITPSPLSINFESYYDFLNFQASESEKQKIKQEKEDVKYHLEIESLKGQIEDQKDWFWKLVVGAIVAQIINLILIFLF